MTAIPLQGPLFDKLKEKLEQVTGKQVILTNQVDPSILGGVIIRMQDDQVDASVKTRLEDLKQHISAIIDYQGKDYSRNIRAEDAIYQVGTWGSYKVPFTFATNGRPYLEQYKTKSGIWFLDLRQTSNVPKALRGWMSPDNILELLSKDINAGNRALEQMPFDLLRDKDGLNLRDYQLRAIQAAEQAIMDGKNTALLAMATGTGKTRTVLGMIDHRHPCPWDQRHQGRHSCGGHLGGAWHDDG